MRPKAIDVKPLDNYIVLVKFDNGEQRLFDVKPYFEQKVFLALKNKELFNTVKIGGYLSNGQMEQTYAPMNYIIIANQYKGDYKKYCIKKRLRNLFFYRLK